MLGDHFSGQSLGSMKLTNAPSEISLCSSDALFKI